MLGKQAQLEAHPETGTARFNVWPVECSICADGTGPIVALAAHEALPGMPPDPGAIERAAGYLRRHGWIGTDDALVCPGCSADQRT